jgi:conjugal transfer pilus assembly protein TraB
MSELPLPETTDELFEPNDTAKKNRQHVYLVGAAVLALLGGGYLYSQFGGSSTAKVSETKRRVQATAQLASSEDAPEVVNGDLQRQMQQLASQNGELQNQNVQLTSAAKVAEDSRATDRADAQRAISALEDELARTRSGASSGPAGVASRASSGGLGGTPSLGTAAAPPLAPSPTVVGAGGGVPAGLAERPHRSMTVIRVNAPVHSEPGEARSAPGSDFANKPGAAAAGAPGVASSAAYFTGRLQSYATGSFVPPNAYASAKVLVGVDSSTNVGAASDPKPVLLRLVGDAVSVGSNGKYQSTSLRGCLVNGAAYGELSSEKVYVKLQRITCPAGDKKFSVATVEGYVSQRGKAGVRGIVVERSGGLTARAAVAGTLQGLGGAFSGNLGRSVGGVNSSAGAGGLLSTEKLSPSEIAQGAVGGGVNQAASMLADYYIKRAEQYQPVIEMPTGTIVEIVFLSGFQVGGE